MSKGLMLSKKILVYVVSDINKDPISIIIKSILYAHTFFIQDHFTVNTPYVQICLF